MMTLDFSPAEEREVQERAQRDGMSLTDYARRQLLAQPLPAEEPEWKTRLRVSARRTELEKEASAVFARSGMTEDELDTYVQQIVETGRAQIHAAKASATNNAPRRVS